MGESLRLPPRFPPTLVCRERPPWNPFAPLNVDAEGVILRKVRFPIPGGWKEGILGEWMWCAVESPQATTGTLRNDARYVTGLRHGARVTFRIIPKGMPDAGFAEAVSWELD